MCPADPDYFVPDDAIFDDTLWPALAAPVPAFERLKVTGAWAGHDDYNALDQYAVIGPDPELPNFIYADGFSGTASAAPVFGRALAESIAAGHYHRSISPSSAMSLSPAADRSSSGM